MGGRGGEGGTLLEVQYFELLLSISLSLSALFGFVNLGDNDQADNLFLGPVCCPSLYCPPKMSGVLESILNYF